MTNFERYAESPYELERLLSAATDAALRAKGCSVKLDFPPDGDWYKWLQAEEQGLPLAPLFPEPPQNETAEQYNARIAIEKLVEIRELSERVNTPFGQAVRDFINEAIDGIADVSRRMGGTGV